MSRPRLIIFVKAPLVGKAKTRLAADIGRVHAWRLYRAMSSNLFRNVVSDKWDTVLAVTPARWQGRLPIWGDLPQYAQVGGSLSPRLAQAFSAKGPTIVIGSDCPQITRLDIDQAFKSIRPNRTVFGPANDGGFWLIGAMGPIKSEIFDHVRWSHEETLKDMIKRLDHRPKLLRTLTDVDNLQALRHVRASQKR